MVVASDLFWLSSSWTLGWDAPLCEIPLLFSDKESGIDQLGIRERVVYPLVPLLPGWFAVIFYLGGLF